jgi:hypothetical protein
MILIMAITFFLFSCSSRKVCGGPGGKRCVELTKKENVRDIS